MRIAIPSMQPGGLKAERSGHFGHCELFTIVDVKDGTVSDVGVIPNAPHSQGGCQVPVDLLNSHGVTGLVVAGIGMRPLMGFRQAGIAVYYAPTGPMVAHAVKMLLDGELQPISEDQTCGGGGNHHHGDGHDHDH